MSNSSIKKTIIYRASVRVRIRNRLNCSSWYWTEETVCRDFIWDPRDYPQVLKDWTQELFCLVAPNIDKVLTSPEVEEIEISS